MTEYQRSFLKWPGGKFSLLKHILPALPQGKRLVEPFVGSGVVFFNSNYKKYLLADNNIDLIHVFSAVKSQPKEFIKKIKTYFIEENNQKEKYLELRNRFNQTKNEFERALLFVYLNRHGFNGLCRYSKKSGYNVPFGRYTKPFVSEALIEAMSLKLQQTQILHADFEKIFSLLKTGDVVYCDPPYVPLSKTANFIKYSNAMPMFDEHAQIQLAMLAKKAAKKNITVIISNHDTMFTRDIYQGAKIFNYKVKRFISCDVAGRANDVSEILAVFGG